MMNCGEVPFGRLGGLLVISLLVTAFVVSGCGYMPRTANQMSNQMDARDQKLRDEINTSKQELLNRFAAADQRLAAVDNQLADLDRRLDNMQQIENDVVRFRAEMTTLRDEIRTVRADLRACVRGELGEALLDIGQDLKATSGTLPTP